MISVILPIYNVEPYLEKCLSSILTNKYHDLEVICVNDGSTDGCLQILQKVRDQDSRIVIIDQENRGLPEARNSGLKVAAGEYIAFIDPDDWVHPQYFEFLLTCIEETNADMVICGCQKVFPNQDIVVHQFDKKPEQQRITASELNKSYYPRRMVWARIYRRKDAIKINFPPEVSHAQDSLFNIRIISAIKHPTVYILDEPLYFYLQRPDSLIKSRSYETMIQSSEWYIKNGRNPHHAHSGDWGWLLLMFMINASLSCRYQASLWNNKSLFKHTSFLLREMKRDMIKDKYISSKEKLLYSIMILIPVSYRFYRLSNDPSLRDFERSIKKHIE